MAYGWSRTWTEESDSKPMFFSCVRATRGKGAECFYYRKRTFYSAKSTYFLSCYRKTSLIWSDFESWDGTRVHPKVLHPQLGWRLPEGSSNQSPPKNHPTGLCGNARTFKSFRSGNNQRISEALVIFVMGKPIKNSCTLMSYPVLVEKI